MIRKIRIIGSVGSGKTTLARKLSIKFDIPYFELDNVVWIRRETGDVRRTEEERNSYLTSIIEKELWIIEGVHNEPWSLSTFKHADLIIFLDPPILVRNYRIIKRYVFQKLGLEKAHYQPTFQIFLKMFKWNKMFEEKGKSNVHLILQTYRDKYIIARKKKDSLLVYNNNVM